MKPWLRSFQDLWHTVYSVHRCIFILVFIFPIWPSCDFFSLPLCFAADLPRNFWSSERSRTSRAWAFDEQTIHIPVLLAHRLGPYKLLCKWPWEHLETIETNWNLNACQILHWKCLQKQRCLLQLRNLRRKPRKSMISSLQVAQVWFTLRQSLGASSVALKRCRKWTCLSYPCKFPCFFFASLRCAIQSHVHPRIKGPSTLEIQPDTFGLCPS